MANKLLSPNTSKPISKIVDFGGWDMLDSTMAHKFKNTTPYTPL